MKTYEVEAISNDGCTLIFTTKCYEDEVQDKFRIYIDRNGWDRFGYKIKEIKEKQ